MLGCLVVFENPSPFWKPWEVTKKSFFAVLNFVSTIKVFLLLSLFRALVRVGILWSDLLLWLWFLRGVKDCFLQQLYEKVVKRNWCYIQSSYSFQVQWSKPLVDASTSNDWEWKAMPSKHQASISPQKQLRWTLHKGEKNLIFFFIQDEKDPFRVVASSDRHVRSWLFLCFQV